MDAPLVARFQEVGESCFWRPNQFALKPTFNLINLFVYEPVDPNQFALERTSNLINLFVYEPVATSQSTLKPTFNLINLFVYEPVAPVNLL